MYVCMYVRKIQFRLYHENSQIFSKIFLNVTDKHAPIKYSLGFDLIAKKMTIEDTNDRKVS